jgi:hypothetical protein
MSSQPSTLQDGKSTLQDIKGTLKKGSHDVADAANDASDEVREAAKQARSAASRAAEKIGKRVKKSARRLSGSADDALESGSLALTDAADSGYGFARRAALRSRDVVYGAEAAVVDFARTRPGKALIFATLGGLVAGAFWRWTMSRR